MKCIFMQFASLLVLISAQEEYKELMQNVIKQCQEEVHIPEELINHLKKLEEIHEPIETKFLFCFVKTVGAMDKAGHIEKDVVKGFIETSGIDKAIVDKFMTECMVEKATPTETIIHSYGCALNHLGPTLRKFASA